MGKGNRDDVRRAYDSRVELATKNMETDLARKLTEICDDFAGTKSRSTLALGVYGDHLIIGIQGTLDVDVQAIKKRVVEDCGVQIKHVHTADKATCDRPGAAAGHHAEMLLIYYMVKKLNSVSSPKHVNQLGGQLTIATTKGCVIHCSYYLAKHGIAHTGTSSKYSTGQAKPLSEPVDGPGMGTWHHPFSGAVWRQTPSGSEWEYQKNNTLIYHKATAK